MRLSEYTDYTLRVLMYCAANPERLITIAELAEHHALSKNHLMKVVNDLARQEVLETTRGRGGGLRLKQRPAEIRVGDIVRGTETDFRLVECFDDGSNSCSLTPSCRLKGVFHTALQAWFKELDAVTLADLSAPTTGSRGPAAASRGTSRVAAVVSAVSAPVSRRKAPAKRLP